MKIGDKVCLVRKDSIYSVLTISEIEGNSVIAVGGWCRVSFLIKEDCPIDFYLRLATPKEIEQGFRDE